MAKIIFLTTEFDKSTGGAIYDEVLYNKISNSFHEQVKLISDDCFEMEYRNVSPNFIRFTKIYKNHYMEITDADYLILNSRLYTRLILFPWSKIKQNCKIIMIHHHFNYMTEHNLKRLIHKHFELSVLAKSDYIVTPNKYTLDICKKLKLVKNVLFIEAESLKNCKIELSKGSQKNFVFVGTIIARKGIHYAIKAFYQFYQSNKDFTFTIVGAYDKKDRYYKSLKKMIEKFDLKDAVLFTNRVTDKEKEEIYKNSFAFLFPSQNEGYGWVMIEAMQHGLPVIAYKNTAMPYTVNKNNGILVENKSIKNLASAMFTLANDNILYDKLRKGAIKTGNSLPEKFTVDKEYEQLFKILRN